MAFNLRFISGSFSGQPRTGLFSAFRSNRAPLYGKLRIDVPGFGIHIHKHGTAFQYSITLVDATKEREW